MALRPVRRPSPAARPMSEAEFQAAVVALARDLGWGVSMAAWRRDAEQLAALGMEPDPLSGLVFHPRFSVGSEPGWPDLAMARRRDRRFLLAELKSDAGRVSGRQEAVIGLLRECGLQVFVWRPADLGAIAEVLR